MIGYLEGKILDSIEGRLTVGVGLGAGVIGYSVAVPQSPSYALLSVGKSIQLWVHTHVREDSLELYGFTQKEERELFLSLISVSGIGPKVGLGLLSKLPPGEFVEAVMEKDQATLTRLPGIGKKTAERLVLELHDSLRKKVESGAFGLMSASSKTAQKAGTQAGSVLSYGQSNAVWKDAQAALVGLGYRDSEVGITLQRLKDQNEKVPESVEEVVRTALRQMNLGQ